MLTYDSTTKAPPRIRRVKFHVLSTEEIRKQSVVEVTECALLMRGLPAPFGLNDARMGVVDRRLLCTTCGRDVVHCPGHVGHIELPFPMYHSIFFETTIKTLRCLCFMCSRVCLSPEEAEAAGAGTEGKQKLISVYAACKARKKCVHCGTLRPTLVRHGMSIRVEWPSEMEWESEEERLFCTRPFTQRDALSLLRNITDGDCAALGFDPVESHPKNMICEALVVPPPSIRPTIMATEGSKMRGTDDLTQKLQDILKRCQGVRNAMRSASSSSSVELPPIDDVPFTPDVAERVGRLQYDVFTLVSPSIRTASATTAGKGSAAKARAQPTSARATVPQPAATDAGSGSSGSGASGSGSSGGDGPAPFARSVAARRRARGAMANEKGEQGYAQAAHALSCASSGLSGFAGGGGGGGTSKSYISRLKGKEGRIRGSLLGKRVDFCARCVISPGPTLDLDQVGIPMSVATTLTVPEVVTELNISALTRRVRVGAGNIDGAETVITNEGVVLYLAHCETRNRIRLVPGYTVERYLRNDDVVAFNRQPSLHKMSMMAHRVLIVPGDTFRMNLSVTQPYNADFDGDEMNVHVAQSPQARASMAMLMMVTDQILSPQANKPCMGLVQDTVVGLYRLTRLCEHFDQRDASHVLSYLRHDACKADLPHPAVCVRGRAYWTGKQVASSIFPASLNLSKGRPTSSDGAFDATGYVLVRRGELISGRLSKSLLGTASGGVVDVVCRDEGSAYAARMLSDAQRLVIGYNELRGFSVGMADCVLGARGREELRARLDEATRLADEISNEASHDGVSAEDAKVAESTIRRILSKALTQAGSIVEQGFSEQNSIRNMVLSASKGSVINLSQIGACVGQQSVEGKRIAAEKGLRTLPCFRPGDRSLRSRGFVTSSYVDGLRADEYFFHAMGGREGLSDTAVKTSETGYLQRRQVKAMESHTVRSDGTVRNAGDDVIQFSYAATGLDASRLERVSLPVLLLSSEAVRAKFCDEEDAQRVLAARDEVLRAVVVLGMEVDARVSLPFSPRRMRTRLEESRSAKAQDGGAGADERLRAEVDAFASFVASQPSAVVRLAMLDEFPRASLMRDFSADEVKLLRTRTRDLISKAKCAQGESVGCIAAQSSGEPFTQMTLNSFHTAGIAAKNVTLGIPRVKEILTVTKNLKTPMMTLRFKGALAASEAFASYMADTLPATTLGDIACSTEIVDDPSMTETCVDADKWMVHASACVEGVPDAEAQGASRFVIRIVLNRSLMRTRRLTPPDVRQMLRTRMGRNAHCISSETNQVDWVLRIRLHHVRNMVRHANMPEEREAVLAHRVVNVLYKTLLVSGHAKITAAHVRAETSHKLSTSSSSGHLDAVSQTEYVVDATGEGFAHLAASPCVDWERTYYNDLCELQSTLGISAAAEALFMELFEVISFDGTWIYPGHLQIVVDTMTRDGRLKPLTRFGVNKEHSNALARASFEETPDVLSDAALFAENSLATGVSTSVILGQRAEIGTGTVALEMHSSMLPAALQSEMLKTSRIAKTQPRPSNVLPQYHTEYVLPDDDDDDDDAPASRANGEKRRHDEDDDASEEDCMFVADEDRMLQTGGAELVFATEECVPPFVGARGDDAGEASAPAPALGSASASPSGASCAMACDVEPFRLDSPETSDEEV